MADLTVKTVDNEQKFVYEKTIEAAGLHKVNLETENTFLDKDINIQITTPAATAPSMEIYPNNNPVSIGTLINGVYEVTTPLNGTLEVDDSGWINSGSTPWNTIGIKVGTIDRATLDVEPSGDISLMMTPNAQVVRQIDHVGLDWEDASMFGRATIAPESGKAYVAVTIPGDEDNVTVYPTVTASGYVDSNDPYYENEAVITAGWESTPLKFLEVASGTVSSGSANISSVNVAYNTTGGIFNVTGSADIPAPTVSTAGYVSNGVGTLSGTTNGATVTASVAKIGIAATLTGSGTAKPVIATNVATNVDASAATTTQPASGFYVAVNSPANTNSVSATAAVTSAGYGTTTVGQYTATESSALTVGAEASDVTYVPIGAASFANSAANGHSYTDISTTAPILISNDYLYINKGYTNDVKISLSKLVPDDATITASTGASYMLNGQSAYDSDGKLVVGNIPTYGGAYTVA